MAHAAVPILVGTGVQILGAEMGWDPRLTAVASIAAGGISGGFASGAFAGGVPGTAAMSPGVATNAFNPSTTGVLAGSQAGQTALASRMAAAGGISGTSFHPVTGYQPSQSVLHKTEPSGFWGKLTGQNSTPYYNPNPVEAPAVAEVKAPFFDRTQYTSVEKPYTLPDGTEGVQTVKVPKIDGDGNIVKGMSQADALGVNMLDTFMQYELALAQQPKPRPTRSGGGGGGGGGPAASYQGGGGGSGQKQVTWGFGGGNNNGYQPQGLV